MLASAKPTQTHLLLSLPRRPSLPCSPQQIHQNIIIPSGALRLALRLHTPINRICTVLSPSDSIYRPLNPQVSHITNRLHRPPKLPTSISVHQTPSTASLPASLLFFGNFFCNLNFWLGMAIRLSSHTLSDDTPRCFSTSPPIQIHIAVVAAHLDLGPRLFQPVPGACPYL